MGVNCIVTVGAEVFVAVHCCNIGNPDHCWLTSVTSDDTTVTLDIIVAFDTIDAFVIPFK
jgi:hypothetical protein